MSPKSQLLLAIVAGGLLVAAFLAYQYADRDNDALQNSRVKKVLAVLGLGVSGIVLSKAFKDTAALPALIAITYIGVNGYQLYKEVNYVERISDSSVS